MDKTKGIFWLASYPKSGNTWFRIVLNNLLNKTPELEDLDEIHTGAIASSRGWIDNVLGFDSASLTHDELEKLLPSIYRFSNEEASEVGYHKIHNAYTYLDKKKKKPLLPADACLGAIYIMRSPLDVAISFANHNSCTIDNAIAVMGDKNNAYSNSPFTQSSQIRHKLSSWSAHVESWNTAKELNVLCIRYEDMKASPQATFSKAMDFLQIKASEEEIALAIDNANIDKLKELEKKSGFKERPANVETFFRKGIVGDWEKSLTSEQVRHLVRDHAVVMNQYGYLNDELVDFF